MGCLDRNPWLIISQCLVASESGSNLHNVCPPPSLGSSPTTRPSLSQLAWGSWNPWVMPGPLHVMIHPTSTSFLGWLAGEPLPPSRVRENGTSLGASPFSSWQRSSGLTIDSVYFAPCLASLFRMQIPRRCKVLSVVLTAVCLRTVCLAHSRCY